MSATDLVTVGRPLPRIRAVAFDHGHAIAVTWDEATRQGSSDVVDLAPLLFRLKFYAPLRHNPALMRTVHTIEDGTAIAWDGDAIDMAAASVLRLSEEGMSPTDFTAFMKRHGFTVDGVAAELGISSQTAASYVEGRSVPRYIALACRFIGRNVPADP